MEAGNGTFKVRAQLAETPDWSEISGFVKRVTEAFFAGRGNDDQLGEILVTPAMSAVIRTPLSPIMNPVKYLVVAVAMLPFVVACANLAGLLLARAERRGPEAVVLMALGARRGRIIRSQLVETTMVALLGGCLSVAIAMWLLPDTQLLFNRPVASRARLDASVVIFALGLSMVAGLALGLMPTPKPTSRDRLFALGGQGTGRVTRTSRIRSAVFVGQVAGTVALLVAAGLFVRSLLAMERADPGFGRHPAAIADRAVAPTYHGAPPSSLRHPSGTTLRQPPGRLRGFDRHPAARGITDSTSVISISDAVSLPGQEDPQIHTTSVGGDYFDVLGIPLVAGRFFDERDRAGSAPVAIASQTAARLWPRSMVVGRSYQTLDGVTVEVVGVVADTKGRSWSEPPPPLLYIPVKQAPYMDWRVVARTVGSPASIVTAMRDLTAEMDYEVTVTDAKTMEEYLSFTRMPALLPARMLISLSLLALVLAAVGLYGIVSYNVAARTREMAIRTSVGAAPIRLVGLALRSGLKLVAIGLPVAAVLADGIRGFLYGVDPFDPLTFAGATAVVLAVAAMAAYLSARHASRIDPIQVLRAG